MKLILCDRNVALCQEWQRYFKDDVTIINGTFTDVDDYECIVSPANSFGIMDGGFDGALTKYFGLTLQNNVQAKIKQEYAGEQPVGTCIIVPTGNQKHPYCAHTPTMRVPRVIREYDTIYNAMRSMLLATRDMRSVLCTGLGTATGRVPLNIVAYQMYLAWLSITEPPKKITWDIAENTERRIRLIP